MSSTMKHPEDMSAAELAKATKAFDKPCMFERARPMTSVERAEERKLRRSRPKVVK